MRNIKFLLPVLFIINSTVKVNAQNEITVPIDPVTKMITYEEVVKETGTKDELYDRCVKWFNSFYKNITNVTKYKINLKDVQKVLIDLKYMILIIKVGKQMQDW